jgi:hypothetical protein
LYIIPDARPLALFLGANRIESWMPRNKTRSEDYGVQAVLESCGLTRPDVGEQYWRLPAEISIQALQVKPSHTVVL